MPGRNAMSLEEVRKELKARAAAVEKALKECCDAAAGGVPAGLLQAMSYSLLAGGKRLRPALCLTFAALFGLAPEKVMPFAVGIECIHTYSLIHDDLPCMDNDDLRRGKPSCHKRFGECAAVLAGDALLTDAFVHMGRCGRDIDPARVLAAMLEMGSAAGSSGMAGGQFLDMAYTGGGKAGITELAAMHAMKTGAMIRAACVTGAILAGAGEEGVAGAAAYGENLGAAFQIMDDILDETGSEETLGKPVGSDRGKIKLTYPALQGLEAGRKRALEHAEKAAAALAGLGLCAEIGFLQGLAKYVINRVS